MVPGVRQNSIEKSMNFRTRLSWNSDAKREPKRSPWASQNEAGIRRNFTHDSIAFSIRFCSPFGGSGGGPDPRSDWQGPIKSGGRPFRPRLEKPSERGAETTYMNIHESIRIYTNIHEYARLFTKSHKHTRIHTHIHEYTRICMNIHEYTRTYTHIHES